MRKVLKWAALAAGGALVSACAVLPLAKRPLAHEYALLPEPAATNEPGPPEQLTARFFGTSTLTLSDGATTIMTDGFFTRPSILELVNFPVTPSRRRIEAALAKGEISRVAAIFVAHSHHDHAMDAPYVASLTGADIVGSPSTAMIALGAKFPSGRIRTIGDGSVCRFGRFQVTAYRTPHSSPMLFPGEITDKLHRRAWVEDYKEGGNFTFHVEHPWGKVLIVPGGGARLLRGVKAETVFLGVGGIVPGKEKLQPAWNAFVEETEAKRVYPIHWDYFFKPPGRSARPRLPGSVSRKRGFLQELARRQVRTPAPEVLVPPYADPIPLKPGKEKYEPSNAAEKCPRWKELDGVAD